MTSSFNNSSLAKYGKLFLILGLVATWQAGGMIDAKLQELPVKEAPHAPIHSEPLAASNIFPVWVRQAMTPQQSSQQGATPTLATAFAAKVDEEVIKKKSEEPDYSAIFRQAAKINGVSQDGVFINKQFYQIGDPISPLGMTSPITGKKVVPYVKKITKTKVLFIVGSTQLEFSYE